MPQRLIVGIGWYEKSQWPEYRRIMVDDVDAKLSEIVSAGGRVIQPQTDIEGYGISIGIFADTEGNVMGVYSPLAAS